MNAVEMIDPVQNKKLIIVIGMHRSGTSAITKSLTTMGVHLGERLMEPAQGNNEKGFFEDLDFFVLNEALLKACGRKWHSLEPLQRSDVDSLCEQGYLKEATELLNKKLAIHACLGIKDPRMSKLFPFWSHVFKTGGFNVDYVLAVRNPISVAKSLKTRDGLDSAESYFLWIEHTVSCLVFMETRPAIIVDFDQLMEHPRFVLQRLAQALDQPLDQEAVSRFTSEFLEERLRHSRYTVEDVLAQTEIPILAKNIYKLLIEQTKQPLVAEPPDEKYKNLYQQWQVELETLRPIFRLVNQQKIQINSLQQLSKSQADHITELKTQIVEFNQILNSQKIEIKKLNKELTTLDTKVAELHEETVRRGEWALGLQSELDETNIKLKALASSNSWRITMPLRETRRWLTSPKKQAIRYTQAGLSLAKKTYQTLPLSHQTQTMHRRYVARLFPRILTLSGSDPSTVPIKQQLLNINTSDRIPLAKDIYIPHYVQPLVSIIIPVYGKIEYTLQCLVSIALNIPKSSFEIIIVDDCSPDDSFFILSNINGIRILKNNQNKGFIHSCNTGADAAKGEYLYFLNNDTQVTADWLDELVRTYYEFPGTGLAGSKLIYPDGRLQEAGGIIWRDGSAWNFGRFQDPQLPVYNYAREVDYCSGASIMIPRQLFNNLGGFDTHYTPAYCEDSDLALKIREKGYRVIYQPLSAVFHFEGVTSGLDTTQGTKAYQVVNSEKQYARWHHRLNTHQVSGQNVDSAKDRQATRRVLVLDHCTPTPDQDSGSIDAYNHMLLFREMGFQVTFIPEDNFLFLGDYTRALQRAGIEMLYAPYVRSVEQHLKEYGHRYDLVFIARPIVFQRNINIVRHYCPTAKVFFHTVDLHFLRLSREAAVMQSSATQQKATDMKTLELGLMRIADVSTVVSTEELAIIQDQLPHHKIRLLPYARTTHAPTKPFNARKNIVFVGSFQHTPNVDAVQYFVHEIMPLLRILIPDVRFYIVGNNPPNEIKSLASIDIIIAGFISDLRSFLENMRVSVAPIRFGAGIKGKVGTAMAVGLPVVATTVAAEGMSLTHGEHLLLADNPETFANAIKAVYQDETLWSSLSQQGLAFANQEWGSETAWNNMADILGEIGLKVTRGKYPLSLFVT